MTWTVAKHAIDLFFANIRNNPAEFASYEKTIFFYGGEPLINFSLIEKIVDYVHTTYKSDLEAMGPLFEYSLITNGTLITKEIAKFLAAHREIKIGISIDGSKAIHDQLRVYRNGRGSFTKTISGYKLLKEAGCTDVAVSCTIDSHNIDNLESLLTLQKEYGFSSINLNPLLDTEDRIVDLQYAKKASERMLEYFERARKEGIYEDRIMKKLKAFISHQIHAFDCMATGNQLVCAPDGQLGLCHEGVGSRKFFFADIHSKFAFHQHPLVLEWNTRSPLNMPQCYNCPAIGICGGGCTYNAYLRNGSIWSIDDKFCIHSLKTLEWMIWDLYRTF
jgi:uncharacterized protein